MSKIFPQNDILMCTALQKDEKKTESGFVYMTKDALPMYRVISHGPKVAIVDDGDMIVVNSTGNSKVELNGIEYTFFKEENVVAKVVGE